MNKLLLTPLLLLANFIVANAQIVSIPDANFKSALVGNPAINTNNDSEIQVSEAIAYSGWISVDNLGIVNLSGLSSFSNITGLSCSNNLLTSIDISNNGGVNYFYCNDNQINTLIFGSNMPNTVQCANNQLTSISLPNGSALYYLKCSNNSLTAIDVTQQFNLHILEVDDNLLSMLNLGSNYQLYDLNCAQNQITSLDISPCPLTSFNSINNPLLTCIKVANVANANSNTNWFKDVTATYSLNCATPIVSIPDPNFKSALVANPAINTNADAEIQVSEANAYSGTINVSNLNISDLTGINSFTSINHLFCANNQLTNLDVSSLSNLITLNCSFNLLTSLNLSNNLFIDDLNCGYNQIQVLDVSMLGNLHYLECTSNQLTSLNLSNSNALIDLKCGVNQLSQLDVSATTILSMLQCQSNQLTSLNLGVNTNLITLWCQYNQLTSLDISYCTALQTLTCYDNLISFFDVSLNNNLGYLSCHNNSLSCIKVANVATANAQATWYKDAQASYSQYCLNGTIPTTLTTIPEINLLVSNLTTGQNTSILGNDFTPNSTVHLLVKNSLGLTILDSALLSNSIGKISCQWLIPNSVTTGTYFIAAFDSIANYTTSPARILQVTNTSTPIIQKYITIQNPIATSTYQQGDIISISFSDKIIVANNPNTNGLISKFYSIDYRINGGTWQPISNITKKGLYNNWISINSNNSAPSDGNYEVRVQEVQDNTLNEEITPSIYSHTSYKSRYR
jgi:Leucine-rich repeat (LRR) protein